MGKISLDFVKRSLFSFSPLKLCILLDHLLQWLDSLRKIRHKPTHEVYCSHEGLHSLFIMRHGDLFNGLDSFWVYRYTSL